MKRQTGLTLLEVLAAFILIGIGVALFTKVHRQSSGDSSTNSRYLIAGKMIEKFLEDTRIHIAKDTVNNWPPVNQTLNGTAPNHITLISTISNALSPVDGAVVANVKRMDIKARWTSPRKDSLMITTYVSKRF